MHRFKCRLFGSILKRVHANRFNFHGLSVEVHPDMAPDIAYLVYRQRYELPEAKLISKHLGSGDHVVELGASSGIMSALIGRNIGPTGRHIAVEANSILVDLIRRNAGDDVEILTAAVSYSDEDTVNFSVTSDTLGNRIVDENETAITVPTIGLGDLIERYDLIEPVLVCDIEGAERDILEHDKAGLRRCRAVIMEIHPELDGETLFDEQDFLKKFTRIGFEVKERMSRVVYMERSGQ